WKYDNNSYICVTIADCNHQHNAPSSIAPSNRTLHMTNTHNHISQPTTRGQHSPSMSNPEANSKTQFETRNRKTGGGSAEKFGAWMGGTVRYSYSQPSIFSNKPISIFWNPILRTKSETFKTVEIGGLFTPFIKIR